MNAMPSPSRIWGVPHQRTPFFGLMNKQAQDHRGSLPERRFSARFFTQRVTGTIPADGQLKDASPLSQDAALKLSELMDGLPLSIHQMMQEILRDEMDEATQQRLAKRVVRAISLAIPSVEPGIMQAHTHYCMQFIEKWNMTFPEAKRVREYIGR